MFFCYLNLYLQNSIHKNVDKNIVARRINDDPEIKQMLGFLPENFEINDDKKYEKIDVPDFRDGRSGRFIHDFNTNMTGKCILKFTEFM